MRWCCGGHNSTTPSSSSSSSNHSKDAMALTTSEWSSKKSAKKGLISSTANGSKNSGTAASLILRHDQADVRLLNNTEEDSANNSDGQIASTMAAASTTSTITTNNPTSGAQRVLKSSLKLLKGPGRKSSTDSSNQRQKHKPKVQYADKLVVDESLEEDEELLDERGQQQQQNNSQTSNKTPYSYYSGKGGKNVQEEPLFISSHPHQQQSIFYVSSNNENESQLSFSQGGTTFEGGRIVNSGIFHSSKLLNNIENFEKYGPMLLKPCKIAIYITPNLDELSSATAKAKNDFLNKEFGAGVNKIGECSTTASTSTSMMCVTKKTCRFLERLKNSEWIVQECEAKDALHNLRLYRPVVILIDYKIPNLTQFAKNIREHPESEDVLFAVLMEHQPLEKDIDCYSEFQQCFLYSSTDISLCDFFARLASRLRAIPALFAVVEEAEQPIKICDDRNIVQYVNRAYELVTGRRRSDVLGSDASDMHFKTINTHAQSALNLRNVTPLGHNNEIGIAPTTSPTESFDTNGGGLNASRLSFSGAITGPTGGGNGYHPNTRRRSSEWHCITVPSCSNSPQFVYVKRGSADASICRDLSLKSLRSQVGLVDAPITEALSVLGNVLHRCDDETQAQVRDAIKILSSTELYAPTITRFRDNDRIATGYYDGLIRLHHPSRQRKRSIVDAFRENQHRRASYTSGIGIGALGSLGGAGSADTRRRISADVINALENVNFWNFDVIELERITEHHPLSQLGIKVFERWNVAETLNCSMDTVARWLTIIEANYQPSNAYHNATHAADVLQATSYFLNAEAVGQYVQDLHAVSALIAAAVHDLDHPGRGNAYLMNTHQRLAVLYNDHSVLENHHVALAFQLTLTQPGVNIFARVPSDEFRQIRQATIDMVLATDMSRHFEYLTKFQQLMANLPDTDDNREANSLTICRMMIKCADIANPTREWRLCHQWAMRIVEEYFDQTAEESSKGLPLTMKGFDRETCNIPLTQCTFADMFTRETFTLWCEFADLPHLLEQLEVNYECWKSQSENWNPDKENANLLRRSATSNIAQIPPTIPSED